MSGPELARQPDAERPALQGALHVRLRAQRAQLALGLDNGVSFLQKPIMPPQLLSTLRDVLDQPS